MPAPLPSRLNALECAQAPAGRLSVEPSGSNFRIELTYTRLILADSPSGGSVGWCRSATFQVPCICGSFELGFGQDFEE